LIILILIALFGALAAALSIAVAVRLVPPLREPLPQSESRAFLKEAVRFAEWDTKEEIESLRQMMLQQRLEITKLRRREELRRDPRAQELEQRKRRAGNEARHFNELPIATLSSGRTETI
jgi:uncharacterized membrane protein YhiD involved in acid resistance